MLELAPIFSLLDFFEKTSGTNQDENRDIKVIVNDPKSCTFA